MTRNEEATASSFLNVATGLPVHLFIDFSFSSSAPIPLHPSPIQSFSLLPPLFPFSPTLTHFPSFSHRVPPQLSSHSSSLPQLPSFLLASAVESGGRCEFPQPDLGRIPSLERIWCILVVNSDVRSQQFYWYLWETVHQMRLCYILSSNNLSKAPAKLVLHFNNST